ncbi:hypothetical protein D3C81_919040 [compost metagenome]
MICHQGWTENFIKPVGIGAFHRFISIEILRWFNSIQHSASFSIPMPGKIVRFGQSQWHTIDCLIVGISPKGRPPIFLGIHQSGLAHNIAYPDATIIVHFCLSNFTLFSLDKNNPTRSPCTIDTCGGCIFQHLNRFNICCIDIA